MLVKKNNSEVTVRRSMAEAFKSSYIENIKNKLESEKRQKDPRFRLSMLTAEELYESIDKVNFDLAEKWTQRYVQWQIERGGKSYSYIKSLASTMRAWDQFCISQGSYAYPAEPQIISLWFEGLIANGRKISTIKQHKAMLSYLFEKIFKIAVNQNPVKDEMTIGALIKNTHRANIDSDTVTQNELQAKPFRLQHLKELNKITNPSNAIYFRDLTFISLAYATMVRISELRTIRKFQIQKIPGTENLQLIRIHSKTTDNPLPKTITSQYAKLLNEYLNRFCKELGPNDYIFSYLTQYHGFRDVTKPMSLKGAIAIFHRADRRLNPKIPNYNQGTRDRFTGHSARVGGAIDGFLNKMTIAELKMLGDWKSEEMLSRYLRGITESINVNLQKDFKI